MSSPTRTAATAHTPPGRLRHLPELLLAALVVGVAALLVAPLPAALLDVLLAINLALAVVLLLVALSVQRPLSVSAFPAILLVATLLRLGLNVSSTRLILRDAWAGHVIDAFASWVVAGSLVVGVVIFLILTVIQFVVIARGGERVAEVAARFALDAMPGRQMAIDADLRAGAITLAEATAVRDRLQRESRLYGAMDGAMKFVKGDALAGLFILAVDLLGGLAVGVLERGMGAADALRVYGLLTIGDGLVTQIPALLVAIGAALVVTRVASVSEHGTPSELGGDIARQLGEHPRALLVAAAFLLVLAALPGLPAAPFALIAALLAAVAVLVERRRAAAATLGAPADGLHSHALPPRLAIELPPGAALDPEAVLDTVTALAAHTGAPLPTPVVTLRDADADADDGRIVVRMDGFALGGEPLAPAEATPARLREQLVRLLPALLSMQDVQRLLDAWDTREPALVRALAARRGGLAELTRVLRALLADRLPIAPLRPVLEALLALPDDAPLEQRVDAARTALAVHVARDLQDGARPVLLVGPRIERMLADAAREPGARLTLGAPAQREILDALAAGARRHLGDHATLDDAALSVGADARRALHAVLHPHAPHVLVVATEELAAAERLGVSITPRATLDVGRA